MGAHRGVKGDMSTLGNLKNHVKRDMCEQLLLKPVGNLKIFNLYPPPP